MRRNSTRGSQQWSFFGDCHSEEAQSVMACISCGLLLVSGLNIGILVVRRGLRSPNITARLMGFLAGSDFLLNVVDLIATILDTLGRETPTLKTVQIGGMLHNIARNLSSLLLLTLCIERSYWLVSMLTKRGRPSPSSMASIVCVMGIGAGFLNIPYWEKKETICENTTKTLILDWILCGAHLCSLIVLASLLKKLSSKHSHEIPSPVVSRELGACRSVAFISLTNFIPVLTYLSTMGILRGKCIPCLPAILSVKSCSLVAALRPVLVFSLSRKVRQNLLSCLRCQPHHQTYETDIVLAHAPNQVGSAENIVPRSSARIGACDFRASVIHCELPAHNISISAQTIMGSHDLRGDLHNDPGIGGSSATLNAAGTPQGPQGQPQPQGQGQQLQPRLSLLSVSWKKDASPGMPCELRASSETLHSVTSISSPFFAHRIDVRVNTPIDMVSPEGEGTHRRPTTPSTSPSPPKQSQSASPQPPQKQSSQVKQSADRGCRRTLSSTVENGPRHRSMGPRVHPPGGSTRSQSLPIICIQRDSPKVGGHRLSSTTATSDILLERSELGTPSCGSSQSYSVLSSLPPAPPGRLYVLEGPHLPGAIMTPPGLPRRYFSYAYDRDQEGCSSTSSDLFDSPTIPLQCSSSVDILRLTASPLPPPAGADVNCGNAASGAGEAGVVASAVDLHAECSGVYIGTVEM